MTTTLLKKENELNDMKEESKEPSSEPRQETEPQPAPAEPEVYRPDLKYGTPGLIWGAARRDS